MLSSTSGSTKYLFLHNNYSPSSQGSNGIFLNPMTCPSSSSPLNPNIEMPSNQEKASQGLHFGPSSRRSVRKEYKVKKIYTAQGLRDRRVRLSKEVAHKFFKLQDTLGFDKASKTLEWLLNESEKAIEQLGSWKTVSRTSEEEEKQSPLSVGGEKGKSTGLKKESRAKARARARERTRAKTMNSGGSVIRHEENCDNFFQFDPLKQLSGWSLRTQEYLDDVVKTTLL